MDEFSPGEYTFNLQAISGDKIADFTYSLILTDPCNTASLNVFQQEPLIDMQYDLGTEKVTQKFNVNDIFSLETNVDCGVISLEFTDEKGMPLSDEIFSI